MSERHYDPEIAPIVPSLPTTSDWSDMPKARSDMVEMIEQLTNQREPEGVTWTDPTIPGPAGDPEVSVRVYRPDGAEGPLPGVLWIHGGGFCLGSIESEHVGAAGAANAAQASDAFRGGYAPTPTPAGQCGRIGGRSIVGVYTSAGLPERQWIEYCRRRAGHPSGIQLSPVSSRRTASVSMAVRTRQLSNR